MDAVLEAVAKILESVLYHHGYNLKSADIDEDSYAYIT